MQQRGAHARMHISERGGARVLPKCSVGRGLAVSRSCHLIMPPPGSHLSGAPITLAPPHIVGAGTTILPVEAVHVHCNVTLTNNEARIRAGG